MTDYEKYLELAKMTAAGGGMRLGMKEVGEGKTLIDFNAVVDIRVARRMVLRLNMDPADIEKLKI